MITSIAKFEAARIRLTEMLSKKKPKGVVAQIYLDHPSQTQELWDFLHMAGEIAGKIPKSLSCDFCVNRGRQSTERPCNECALNQPGFVNHFELDSKEAA